MKQPGNDTADAVLRKLDEQYQKYKYMELNLSQKKQRYILDLLQVVVSQTLNPKDTDMTMPLKLLALICLQQGNRLRCTGCSMVDVLCCCLCSQFQLDRNRFGEH